MKIDIHTHTKKTKKGDPESRNIDAAQFHEIISSTEVKIVAITNHNVFDYAQYSEFVEVVGGDFQVWPGVELDIKEADRRGHLIVIVSPESAQLLGNAIANVTGDMTPDSFNISIDEVLEHFEELEPLYIAHYKAKKPDLSDDDIQRISDKTKYKNRVLKEASNAISAGIFISHGHRSIYGSDVQIWAKYESQAKRLPDLRLPVESFEQFCLLLNRDDSAINTLIDTKQPENITIKPFKDDPEFSINVYDDINVLFGAKGTGKTDILDAIEGYYSDKGITAKSFKSTEYKLNDAYDIKAKKVELALADYDISYCVKEVDSLRKSKEVDVTSISKYKQFFSRDSGKKKAGKIKITGFDKENTTVKNREFKEVQGVFDQFLNFKNYVVDSDSVDKHVDDKKKANLLEILDDVLIDLEDSRSNKFIASKTARLFNQIIEEFKSEIARKTGLLARPGDTGFYDYSLNRIGIELNVNEILGNINKKIAVSDVYVGSLDEKGALFCRTILKAQNGKIKGPRFSPVEKVTKRPQVKFATLVNAIKEHIYTDELFEKVAKLNAIEGAEDIKTILELMMISRCFVIDDREYVPSTGESLMILLHQELNEDKDVYILDEPEKSLGHEYINNVVVPLIKDKAKAGKKVFIATHDANIAVRTLPCNSIYRCHSQEGYATYVGNPFSNYLVNINNPDDKIDWKEISMKTLEGGRSAFGERGQIYGNS